MPEAVVPETTDSTGELVDTASAESEAEQKSHPNEAINVEDRTPCVYFNELNADSLNILFLYWYHPADYEAYLEHATWINVQVMERFNAEGF